MSAPYFSAEGKRALAQQVAGAPYYHPEAKPQQQQQKKQKQQHSKPQGQAQQGQQGQQQQSRKSKAKQQKKQIQQQQQSLQYQPLWLQQQQQLQRLQDHQLLLQRLQEPLQPLRAHDRQPLLLYPATKEDATAADRALEMFVQSNLQQPVNTGKTGSQFISVPAAEVKALVKMHCPALSALDTLSPSTAAAAFPRILPVQKSFSPGIIALQDCTHSDAALLTVPGLINRIKQFRQSDGTLIKAAQAAPDTTGGDVAQQPAEPGPTIHSSNESGVLEQAAAVGLASWLWPALKRLVALQDLNSPVNLSTRHTLSECIRARVLADVHFARLLAQVFNLLLRGGLPQLEVQAMQDWIARQQHSLRQQQPQPQQALSHVSSGAAGKRLWRQPYTQQQEDAQHSGPPALAAAASARLASMVATAQARMREAELLLAAPCVANTQHAQPAMEVDAQAGRSASCTALYAAETLVVLRAHCPELDMLAAGSGTSSSAAAAGPPIQQYNTAAPLAEQYNTAAGTAAGQYLDLPLHQYHLPGTADRQKDPHWITSDAFLLSRPGLEARCKTDDVLDMLPGAFDALGLAVDPVSMLSQHACNVLRSADSDGFGVAQPAGRDRPWHPGSVQGQNISSQRRPGLLAWFTAARDVLLGLLQEDVVVEVPGEVDFEGLLMCIVRLARLVVQVHHLLLRGDLPMHEKLALGFD